MSTTMSPAEAAARARKASALADMLALVGVETAEDVAALTESSWLLAAMAAGTLRGRPMGVPSERTRKLVADLVADRAAAGDPFLGLPQ